jgi:hypothetical protein
MAKMPYGPMGPVTGKLGTIIGVIGKSGPYVYAVPKKRKDRPSPAQKIQRAKLAAVSQFLLPMRALLPVTFNKEGDTAIPWNKAVSHNIKNAVYESGGKQKILYSAVLLSQGVLPNPLSPAVSVTAPGTLTYTWTDNSGKGKARASDRAILIVYCETFKQCVYITNGAYRSVQTDALQIPGFKGKKVQAWLAFRSASGQEISPSVYMGELVL